MNNYPSGTPPPFYYDPAYENYQFPPFQDGFSNSFPNSNSTSFHPNFPANFSSVSPENFPTPPVLTERNENLNFDLNLNQNQNLEIGKNEEGAKSFKWMSTKRPGKKATDKKPTTFSKIQSMELEKEFIKKNYLEIGRKDELSARLGLTPTQIKTWFQNRRMKEKKFKKPEISENSSPESSAHFGWPSNY